MKTTVKLSPTKSITVEPAGKHCKGGIIATLNFEVFGIKSTEAMTLTPDQCGALIFGIEQGLERADKLHSNRIQFEASAG